MMGLLQSSIQSLPLVYRGKVRDSYAVGDDKLLIVTTDRLSAFDVVMRQPIPDKGRVLNAMSNFWFDRLGPIVANHLTGIAPESVVDDGEREQVRDRAVVAWKLQPLPVEAVVRGYLIGSGWKDYQRTGQVCGVDLPGGLNMAGKLATPIFTPASKEALGTHDENISFERMQQTTGDELASRIRSISLALYAAAAEYAATRGIIIADTKFEFGIDPAGQLRLMDEVLTADSSRFWPADQYVEGASPPSFDKQFVRDWLETQDWDKTPPPPDLPGDVVAKTADKYREALLRLTGTAVIGTAVTRAE
ncbi:MAG: phosphoribosylaminoimidazolesuccinocarboxamide synthase [Burkholderiaceae bacterium]|nr:phosphoribosylaminoimidazolesuccinocarboxamide synthase [Burkholderiaceae bacterium]